jgi:hypothetical protein
MKEEQSSGFKQLLLSMMDRRWLMTLIVLITFMLVTFGILLSIHSNTEVSGEWKELLLSLSVSENQ